MPETTGQAGAIPIIVVFDDAWPQRKRILEQIVGPRATLRGFPFHTRYSRRKGDAAAGISLDQIAQMAPSAIISDLALFPDQDNPRPGLDLARDIRMDPDLGNVPLIVVSKHAEHERARSRLEQLGVKYAFVWRKIEEGEGTEREKLSEAIDEALKMRPHA